MGNENGHRQQLMMLRRALPAPAMALREGWSVRGMREGEWEAWARIMRAADFLPDDGRSAEEQWNEAMGSDPGVKTENVFFVCDPSGAPVATATARLIPDGEQGRYPFMANGGAGYLHFVATAPECRGMGAGSAATAAVLRRFAELGLETCVLTTDDYRLAAVKIYLGMGWLPVLRSPDMRMRWEKVLGALGIAGEIMALEADGTPAAPIRPEK